MDETNTQSFIVGVVIIVLAFLIIKIMTRTAGDTLLKIPGRGKGKLNTSLYFFFFFNILHFSRIILLHDCTNI